MLFTSIQFVLFFALVLLLFHKLPAGVRRPALLMANYVFYMWAKPVFGLLLLLGTLITYLTARAADSRPAERRRGWIAVGVVCMLGQQRTERFAALCG